MTHLRSFTVTLPAGLELANSNQRLHHIPRAKLTAAIRGAAMEAVTEHPELMAALAAAKPGPLLQHARIVGVFCPPTRRRADPANWYPSFKAAVDGLVDAGLLEDDDHTRLIGPDMRIGPVVKRGQLVLHVHELTPGLFDLYATSGEIRLLELRLRELEDELLADAA